MLGKPEKTQKMKDRWRRRIEVLAQGRHDVMDLTAPATE